MARPALAQKYLNPGCIKYDGWNHATRGVRGHAKFDDLEWGIRAMIRCMAMIEHIKGGTCTLREMLHVWAPGDDTIGSIAGNAMNDPDWYAEVAGRYTRMDPDAPFSFFAPDGNINIFEMGPLLACARIIEKVEAGYRWVPMAVWMRGIARYIETYPDMNKGKG